MLSHLRCALPAARACLHLSGRSPLPARVCLSRGLCASGKPAAPADAPPPPSEAELAEEENALEGKRTRDGIHSAFSARASDAVRYDYFAQRAELEAELEAASAFRGLREMARQQAMGYMELLEEYGDAEFGSTVDNLDVCAAAERELAEEVYRAAAGVAAEEDLGQIEEWFEDMSAASDRAASRLELVSSMLDAEDMGEEAMEEEGEDAVESTKR